MVSKRSMKRSRNMNRRRSRQMRGGDIFGFGKPAETLEQKMAREAQGSTGQQSDPSFLGSITNKVTSGVNTFLNDPLDTATETAGNLGETAQKVLIDADNKVGELQVEANGILNNTVDATREQASEITSNIKTGLSNIIGSESEGPIEQDPTTVGGKIKPWYQFWGGKRHMRGGQGLGLTYYATPVNGLKVAEPTYMEYYTGGRRKRSTRKRRSCKRRRHCRKTCHKRHKHCKK